MNLKAHISNIHQVAIAHLQDAQTDIVAAVALFTHRGLFDVLCSKARNGVKVSVVLLADKLQQGPRGLNFNLLSNLGGDVIIIRSDNGKDPIAHHSFCVIDGSTVITGSENWPQQVCKNDDYITVVAGDSNVAGKYRNVFDGLIAGSNGATLASLDISAVKRRLDLIRNLVMLGELDDIAPHLGKLRPVAAAPHLSKIIAALDKGEFSIALEEIDAYGHIVTALVSSEQVDVSQLRFFLNRSRCASSRWPMRRQNLSAI